MMAYWAESQGQSPVYAKYCTVPGPNCTHMYHDRHKATYLPLPLCDQREPNCWTVPGSRTGGILHDYTNWTNPDLAAPAASHFPFGLDNPNKDHPQPQETRGRERRAGGYRGAPEREYELGDPNEGWQRRWEPGSSSSSLSDSSYRELQAWAARYSHSLPRRRRMGAEMKGAFQEAPETSRTLGRVNRHATDPHMAALQRSESYSGPRGPMWVGGHQKTMTNNPLPVCSPESTMERNTYQRMRFSQPPGYIGPPAYDGQHNSSPGMQYHNTFGTGQQAKRNTSYLKSTQPNQNMSSDLQDIREGNKEKDTKESQKQRSALDSNSYEDQIQATNTLWQNQPIYSQPSQVQPVSHSSPREVQESKPTEGISSNVIEGRKFRLNQRTGGATIFCLVSRMCESKSETLRENVETKAVPHCTRKSNSESSELGGITKGLMDDTDIIHRMTKLADEVDFNVENLSKIPVEHTIPSRNGKDTIGLVESQEAAGHKIESQTGCSLANQTLLQSITEKGGVGDVNSVVGPQVGQTSPLRFPLWREPGYTARMDKNSSLRCRALVNNSPTGKSTDMCGLPIDIEVRRFEIKEDEKAESCGGQLVIDTTSVLVRMELIPSPKKEHVNYLFHPPYNPPNVDTGLVEAIQTQVNPFPAPDEPEPQTDREEGDPTDLTHEEFLKAEELQPEKASELCLPCLPQISPPEKETLTARAERILGIPLLDSNTELTCEETVTVPDLCSENEQPNEQETSPLACNKADVLCLTEGKQKEIVTQLPDDHADESESEFVQDINIPQDVLDTEHNEDPEILRDGKPEISDCPDSKEDVIEGRESQDVEPLGSSVLNEQVFQTDGQEESTEENNLPNENNACSSPLSDPSDLQPESPPDFPCPIQHNSLSCESATETVPPSLIINDASENPEASTHTPQRPCSSTSTDVHPPPCEYVLFPLPITSTPEHPFLNLHCLDSSVHPEDSSSAIEACEEIHELDDSLQLTNNDITDNTNEPLFEDDTEEPGFCEEIAECPKDSIRDLAQQAKENNKEVTALEEQTASSEDNTTDFESLTEVNGLQKLTITTEPLFESCSQEQSNGETERTGDDACPQSVIHCLDPSIVIKDTVDLQCSPLVSEIMPSLDESTFLSDVSDFNSEPALQTDLTSPSVSENKALHSEPFLSGISETSPSGCLESHTTLLFLSSAPLECCHGFPPHPVEEGTVPLELPDTIKDTEESQYPRSLWDAVNRIRKHTAPDSENEDEEVSELWDPQNAIEHLASIEDEGDMESEDIVFPNTEGIGKATVSSTDHDSSDTEEELVLDGTTLLEEPEEEPLEDVTVGLMQQDEHQEAGLQDEDTLSCSHINRQDLEETAVNSAEQVEEEEDIDNNNPELVKEQETTNNKITLDEEEKDRCYDKVEDGLVENEEGGRDETETNHASVLSLPLGCDEIVDCPKESIEDLVQPAEENGKNLPILEEKIAMLSVPPVTDVVQGVTE